MAAGGLDKLLADYLKRIYDGFDGVVDPAIWELNFRSLDDAIASALGDISALAYGSADYKLAMALRNNAATFAVFKNHEEINKLVNLLTDGEGNRVAWNTFKKLAAPLTETYNKTWLETEYNQAISNAEMAVKWNGFKENEDLYPNLQYRAVNDGRTRAEHRALNGTILPMNDPFWNTHYPPNGWGCRCSVTQTDKPVKKPEGIADVAPDKGFDFNPGKDKKLFSDSAGYYDGVDKTTKSALKKEAKILLKGVS